MKTIIGRKGVLALKEPSEQRQEPAAQARRVPAGRPVPVASVVDAENRITIELYDDMTPLETEWRWLEHDPLNSLHHGWNWCRSWQHSHQAPLVILRGERAGRTLFLLPLEVVHQHGIRLAQFIADDFSNLNTGLLAPAFRRGDAVTDAESFQAAITRLLAGRADLVALRNLPLSWRGTVNPLSAMRAIENHKSSFQLPLLGTMDATLKQLNAKRRRKKYKNQLRRLDEIGGYEHLIATNPLEKAALLELFFKQKAVRFAAMGLPDVFREEKTRAFFHALAQAGDDERHQSLVLHAIRLKGEFSGHIAAIAGLSLNGDHALCQFGSIDESRAADTSPGELLFWLMIEQCTNEGYKLFDFGVGDQLYKRSWCSEETKLHDLLIPTSIRGRAARAIELGLIHTKAFIKRHHWLYSNIQRLRAGKDTVTEGGDQAA